MTTTMMIGDPREFAIEFGLSVAYQRRSLLGLGFFLIHLEGTQYGVRSADATLLACSYNNIAKRIEQRGLHTAEFANNSAEALASAVRSALYSPNLVAEIQGSSPEELANALHSRNLIWAPDGDEAFDDGSHVLHFDAGGEVRLIGCKWVAPDWSRPLELHDVRLPSERFYGALARWRLAFDECWESLPKTKDE